MTRFFQMVTHLGNGEVWIPVYLASFLFFRDTLFTAVVSIVLAEAGAAVVIVFLRYVFRRERPDKTYRANRLTPWNRYSFPSHHAARSCIIAVAAGAQYPGMLPPLLAFAGLISFSRVYLAKHYLSDVLVGALLGVALAEVSVYFFSW